MKIYKFSILLLLAVLTISCKNSSTNSTKEDVSIELDNGQKWIVNAEMTPYILESEELLLQYDGISYGLLAEQMSSLNKSLIKSCTMSGKSHDELHKWLHPHMQLIESLGEVTNEGDAVKIISELKESFLTFHTYFQ